MIKFLRWALIIWLGCICSAAAINRAPESEPAMVLGSLDEAIPAGWMVESTIAGHLNGDGLPDAVMSLLQSSAQGNAKSETERSRALLLFLAKPAGGYHQQALARRLLPCTTCLGMLGAYSGGVSPIDISIAANRLRINWLRGSREAVEVNLEFGYDPALGGFRLLRDDVYRVDRVLGKETRTTRDLVTGEIKVDGRTRTVKPSVIPISDVDFRNY